MENDGERDLAIWALAIALEGMKGIRTGEVMQSAVKAAAICLLRASGRVASRTGVRRAIALTERVMDLAAMEKPGMKAPNSRAEPRMMEGLAILAGGKTRHLEWEEGKTTTGASILLDGPTSRRSGPQAKVYTEAA